MLRISLVFLAFLFLASDSYAQGLNRERGRYPGGGGAAHCGTGNLDDCGTLHAHYDLSEGAYCGASLCSDGGAIDSIQTSSDFPSGPTLTCLGTEPDWDEVNANFNNESTATFVQANGDYCQTNLGANQSNATILMVVNFSDINNQNEIWAEQSGTNEFANFAANNTSGIRSEWGGTNWTTTATIGEGTTYLLTWVFDGTTTSKTRIDGSEETGTVATGTANWLTLMAQSNGTSPSGGDVAEFVIYEDALTGTNLTGAECILSDEYSLGLSGC